MARAVGVRRVLLKDESTRFGLPAFKYLGASWAVARTLGGPGDLAALAAAARRLGVRRLAAATDGNHGRAVARLAAQLGLAATILVPDGMVEARRTAIAGRAPTSSSCPAATTPRCTPPPPRPPTTPAA